MSMRAAWAVVACRTEHAQASLEWWSTPHSSWGAEKAGQCLPPVERSLFPWFMMGAGQRGLHDRAWSPPSFLEVGALQCLPRGDAHTPPLVTSRPWSLSPASFSLAEQQQRVAGCSGPGPALCSRLHGDAAKPCVRLRSQPAKPVLGLGGMCPSSRPPGAAAAAGDWAGTAGAGGARSWMKRKEVSICCGGGCSAISSTGAGLLVLARVEFQSSVPRRARGGGCGQT